MAFTILDFFLFGTQSYTQAKTHLQKLLTATQITQHKHELLSNTTQVIHLFRIRTEQTVADSADANELISLLIQLEIDRLFKASVPAAPPIPPGDKRQTGTLARSTHRRSPPRVAEFPGTAVSPDEREDRRVKEKKKNHPEQYKLQCRVSGILPWCW